jgi:hypothetical protein
MAAAKRASLKSREVGVCEVEKQQCGAPSAVARLPVGLQSEHLAYIQGMLACASFIRPRTQRSGAFWGVVDPAKTRTFSRRWRAPLLLGQ